MLLFWSSKGNLRFGFINCVSVTCVFSGSDIFLSQSKCSRQILHSLSLSTVGGSFLILFNIIIEENCNTRTNEVKAVEIISAPETDSNLSVSVCQVVLNYACWPVILKSIWNQWREKLGNVLRTLCFKWHPKMVKCNRRLVTNPEQKNLQLVCADHHDTVGI